MDETSILNQYFPDIQEFYTTQKEAINALLKGKNVLCLMPTGKGKSLIYQVTGLATEKSTLVISPLVALMKQQSENLSKKHISSICFSGMNFREQFNSITDMAQNGLKSFIFVSPEKLSTDGYLEYVLKARKDDIGLVVIDEVHCVSQWGETFRPTYRRIPETLVNIFDQAWPRILCLTATLNKKQQIDVEDSFRIDEVIKDKELWRDNLNLTVLKIPDEKKDSELEKILNDHKGEKILVFVHRKTGKGSTTRTLADELSKKYDGVRFFDSDVDENTRLEIIKGFIDGTIKIVVATSAFGMGIDIEDIRVVVNYRISETGEQYYQEVGRGGRDEKPAWGYLFYTEKTKKERSGLLKPLKPDRISDFWQDKKLQDGDFNHVTYDVNGMTDEQRTFFSLLVDSGLITVIAKGLVEIKCLKARNQEGENFLNDLKRYSTSGLTRVISKKSGKNISLLSLEIWSHCAKGNIEIATSPTKVLIYKTHGRLEDKLDEILADQNRKLESRRKAFANFTDGIEKGKTLEQLIKESLNIR